MGGGVLKALHDRGAVYLSMTGGTAVLGARMVKRVDRLVWEDLGMSEAVWVLDVEGFGPVRSVRYPAVSAEWGVLDAGPAPGLGTGGGGTP